MYGIINKTNVQNVKNTMLDSLLSVISPHLCYSCGKIGSLLCDNCKYNIGYDNLNICIACGGVCGARGVCGGCTTNFTRAWHVGDRTDELRRLIDDYKFENVKAAHRVLAELLSNKIGILPSSVTVVPVPTISSHIRQRGYDHAYLLAKKLAQLQNLNIHTILERASNAEQRGASRKDRHIRAKTAFKAKRPLKGGLYLVVDDIVTTSATLHFTAKTLLDAGADEVWVAVVARQPLDT